LKCFQPSGDEKIHITHSAASPPKATQPGLFKLKTGPPVTVTLALRNIYTNSGYSLLTMSTCFQLRNLCRRRDIQANP